MFEPGLTVRLPCERFVSQTEYDAHAERAAERLRAQEHFEESLAVPADAVFQDATCAPCLRRTRLVSRTAGGRVREDGRRLPDWARGQECDCEERLTGSARLLLHAAESEGGLRSWSRLLLFGAAQPVHRRLSALAGETVTLGGLVADPEARLDAPSAAFQLVVATDSLHRTLPILTLLAELRRVTAPGGCLLATVPFRHRAATSSGREADPSGAPFGLAPREVHAIGWDVLGALRHVGWAEASVLRVWSHELGYLGATNFLLMATA